MLQNPIFNVEDLWTALHIWIKLDSCDIQNWWINIVVKKEHIKKHIPDPFDDLKIYFNYKKNAKI